MYNVPLIPCILEPFNRHFSINKTPFAAEYTPSNGPFPKESKISIFFKMTDKLHTLYLNILEYFYFDRVLYY